MTLNYGNYGIFLIMGDAGFASSTVCLPSSPGFCIRAFRGYGYGSGSFLRLQGLGFRVFQTGLLEFRCHAARCEQKTPTAGPEPKPQLPNFEAQGSLQKLQNPLMKEHSVNSDRNPNKI